MCSHRHGARDVAASPPGSIYGKAGVGQRVDHRHHRHPVATGLLDRDAKIVEHAINGADRRDWRGLDQAGDCAVPDLNLAFGGEGINLTKITGPGKVWLQSLPFGKLQQKMTGFIVEALEK